MWWADHKTYFGMKCRIFVTQDCVSQLRRICKFLKLERPDTFLQEVANKNTIEQIKKVKEDNPDVKRLIEHTSDDGKFIFYRKGNPWKFCTKISEIWFIVYSYFAIFLITEHVKEIR